MSWNSTSFSNRQASTRATSADDGDPNTFTAPGIFPVGGGGDGEGSGWGKEGGEGGRKERRACVLVVVMGGSLLRSG
jgi:hypothetical protein